MEVVNGRDDCLADEAWMLGHSRLLYFPTNFIDERNARIGFYGGTDHTGNGPCSTGFWVTETSGPAVFEALRERRTIACKRGKLAMWVDVGGHGVGSIASSAAPVAVDVRVASPVPLQCISLWRDGRYVEHRQVTGALVEIEFVDEKTEAGDHYYFVRVQSAPDEELLPVGPLVCYSSPTYLTVR